MNVQLITLNDKPEWAVIPYEEYLALVEKAEMAQDVLDFDRQKAAIENGSEEVFPAEVVNALLDGDPALKVWREYRNLSQKQMAEKAGISHPYYSQLETGKRKGSLEVMTSIARVLQVSLEQILPNMNKAQ